MGFLDQAIQQAEQLYDKLVGDGDLTTENLSPYPRYAVAEIRSRKETPICGLALLETLMKRGDSTVIFRRLVRNGEVIKTGDPVAEIEGNGQAIVTGWQVGKSILSLVSHIYSRVAETINVLKPVDINVTHPHNLPVGYDKIIRYAVSSAGGYTYKTGLDENIYLTPEHTGWVKSLKNAIDFTNKEIGESRSVISVFVEVTNSEEVVLVNHTKVNYVYCKGFSIEKIKKLGETTKGWIKLIVDETVPLTKIKELRRAGVKLYQLNVNQFFQVEDLFLLNIKQ